ncbi:MAG: hypothetical protein WCF63_11015 [Acidimicrobiales bacterium]
MDIQSGSTGRTRSVKSRLRSFLGLGSVAALVLGGVAFIGVLPASATAALSFTAPPASVAANAATTYTVAYTAAASGDVITLSSTNCTLSPSGNLTYTTGGTSGNATFTNIVLSGASTGSCALTATDTPTGGTATASVTVTPSTANKLAFTTEPAGTSQAQTALPFTVKVEDQYGNLVSNSDTIVVTSACALGGQTSLAAAGGVASFTTTTINAVGNCYLTATDSTNSGSVSPTTSTLVAVSGGAPAKVAFTVAPPTSVTTTGTVITAFKVAVEDANSNVDTIGTGSTDLITISSTCLAAPVSVTTVAGVATFSTVEFASTGTCVLTATDATRAILTASATSSVGEPQAALTVTSLTGYLDAPLTLVASGGSGTGAVTFSVANGTATGCVITGNTLKAAKAGTCIVTATKAAVSPYANGISAATTVTISSAPHAVKLAGTVRRSEKANVTVSGYNFYGRPTALSNVSGFSAIVTRDSGRSLSITITVKTSASKPGVKVLTLVFGNGTRTSVRYSLH